MLTNCFLDLGMSPLANALVTDLDASETFYPLRVYVCEKCFLVQVPPLPTSAIFTEQYAYFSSVNPGFVEHARRFAADAIERFSLTERSHVLEIGSNDGYLLQHFVERGIPSLGVEPALNLARAAADKGVATLNEFFGMRAAQAIVRDYAPADLIIANNVLAHVPDIHDFVAGLAIVLAPWGYVSIEFPHVSNVLAGQWDTIYHEHYSYLSLTALAPIFEMHGLHIVDVEKLPTHGGSLRVWVRKLPALLSSRPDQVLSEEIEAGLTEPEIYEAFAERVQDCRDEAIEFLTRTRRSGRKIVGYGAPAKAATFLNYCGIKPDTLPYVVDATPFKQGKYLPGCRLPIGPESALVSDDPEMALVLAWNWGRDIRDRARAAGYGGRLVTAIPHMADLG